MKPSSEDELIIGLNHARSGCGPCLGLLSGIVMELVVFGFFFLDVTVFRVVVESRVRGGHHHVRGCWDCAFTCRISRVWGVGIVSPCSGLS